MLLAIMIDVDDHPQYIEYTLANAGRVAAGYITIVGTPPPGQGQMLSMQNYPSVQNAFFFHSRE